MRRERKQQSFLGFRDITRITENQMGRKMEDSAYRGVYRDLFSMVTTWIEDK